jgi:hypothetical protein
VQLTRRTLVALNVISGEDRGEVTAALIAPSGREEVVHTDYDRGGSNFELFCPTETGVYTLRVTAPGAWQVVLNMVTPPPTVRQPTPAAPIDFDNIGSPSTRPTGYIAGGFGGWASVRVRPADQIDLVVRQGRATFTTYTPAGRRVDPSARSTP